MTDEVDRLRRELRAMAVANRQLQAQIEEPVGGRRDRRSSIGIGWIEQLAAVGTSDPEVVRLPDGTVWVLEAGRKRPVRSGILAAAIDQAIGPTSDATPEQLDTLQEGVPVEMFETSSGAPFVVIGGRRHSIRGAPLPYPVDNHHASEFAESDEINLAAANVSRRRFDEAMSGQFQLGRVRATIEGRGVVGTAKAVGARARGRVRRTLAR